MTYTKRILHLPFNKSFFLFGARNTGKSTLLKNIFFQEKSLWIDLLDTKEEERYFRDPSTLQAEVLALRETQYIVIDEIQKISKLLDAVTDKKFILTGSNARKLRYGRANLLAGKAFIYLLISIYILFLILE